MHKRAKGFQSVVDISLSLITGDQLLNKVGGMAARLRCTPRTVAPFGPGSGRRYLKK